MATPQQNGVLMQGDFELEDGCGCFRSFWSSKGERRGIAIDEDDQLNLLPGRREHKESWVVTQFKKLKEASELLAGPKWKNFIRKIGAYVNVKNNKRKDFQLYDSFNYTLNFDDGKHDDGDGGAVLGFSSRFAPPVHDNKAMSST